MKIILTLAFAFCFCSTKAQTDTTKRGTSVYLHPEIHATYPGGETSWTHYLEKNLRYPPKAEKKGVQGVVIIKFMVDTTGSVHDISVIGGPEELREESIRLIKNSKTWIPGINDGKKVNSWKIQPFSYTI